MEPKKNCAKNIYLVLDDFDDHFFNGFSNSNRHSRKCDCQFLEESLKAISEIRIGLRREDLLKNFDEEGGLSTRIQKPYVSAGCRFIKINVKFEPVGSETDKFGESPDDKIIEISKPYLEAV